MNTNVNLLAPIGVMALLGTGFLFFLATLLLIQSLVVRRKGRAKIVMREGETHFVIGHENSPLHSKTRFQL
jgi:hypothetical protein